LAFAFPWRLQGLGQTAVDIEPRAMATEVQEETSCMAEGDHPSKQADLGQKDVTVNDCITPTGMEFLCKDAPGHFAQDQVAEVFALLHSNTFLRSLVG